MKPPIPLSKSASAFQLTSMPRSPLETRTSKGTGGAVVSVVAPVLTYSIHALATAAFGNHTASLALPLYSDAGRVVSFRNAASHALLISTGRRVCSLLPLFGNRIARVA